VAQKLRVLQSLWAMERRLADEPEWPLQTQLAMIRDAGFDGAGVRFIDPAFATDVTGFLRAHGLIWQAQCYPKCVDDLKPVLELVARLGADHVNLQPDVRPDQREGAAQTYARRTSSPYGFAALQRFRQFSEVLETSSSSRGHRS
jgi:sugar phosphate isomerase/epimerase